MKGKKIVVMLVIVAIVVSMIFKDHLIRFYISCFHGNLENYAVEMLEKGYSTSDRYGFWKTSCYPQKEMVEFFTGGAGLVPNSTYEGFYYSSDDTHKLFSAAYEDVTTMKIDGDNASWTDGTDNHGTSERILEKWFWYEASF